MALKLSPADACAIERLIHNVNKMTPSDSSSGFNHAHPNPGESSQRSLSREEGHPTPTADDSLLLGRIQGGEEGAMAILFDRYSKVVFSVALRVLRDPAAAEDVLQDIFMQIWRKPESFISTRGSLAGWLAVIARNRAIDSLRRRKPSDSVDEVVLSSSFNLAEESERNVLIERARSVMVGLPTEQRNVIELAFFEGLTHSEVAERTGDPLGTVKTRIRAGLLVLRKAMQP